MREMQGGIPMAAATLISTTTTFDFFLHFASTTDPGNEWNQQILLETLTLLFWKLNCMNTIENCFNTEILWKW